MDDEIIVFSVPHTEENVRIVLNLWHFTAVLTL
jgi:hypothetical protein